MEQGANTTYVRYRALRAESAVTLTLRCFVNYRSFHANTHAGDWHIAVDAVPGGARVTAFDGARPFWIVASCGTVAIENVWYRDYVLSQETARGLDDRDDNLSAAVFSVSLEPGDAVTLIAADHDPSGGFADDALARRADRDQRILGCVARRRSGSRRKIARRGSPAACWPPTHSSYAAPSPAIPMRVR